MANLQTLGGIHYEMMKRCYNENSVMYSTYGAKGITVCDEWHNRENFKKWALENGYKKGLRLNRIDAKKSYCPENCFFGTKNKKILNGKSQLTSKRRKENKAIKASLGIDGKMRNDALYAVFHSMHSRCERKSHPSYENYGGRGITVCEEWTGKHAFLAFKKWANESGWVKGLTLDRIDNDKGYSPDNCRWATRLEQSKNRRNSKKYIFNGKEMWLPDIAKEAGVKYGMLYPRVALKGMSIEEAIKDILSK